MLFLIVNWIKSSNAVWFFTSKQPSQLDGDNAETTGFFFLFYITISALSYLVPFPSLWQEALGVILAEEKCCITHNSWLKGHVMNNYYIPSFLLNEVERIHSWIQWHLRRISRFLIYVTFWLDAVLLLISVIMWFWGTSWYSCMQLQEYQQAPLQCMDE